jgi:hypothetical protein
MKKFTFIVILHIAFLVCFWALQENCWKAFLPICGLMFILFGKYADNNDYSTNYVIAPLNNEKEDI